MIENDTDIIRTTKFDKKTLLERYDIPVEHLSYEYISECTSAKKLERIVTILRSGEEGYYPDLTKHAEQRLAAVKPTSIILRKTEPVLKRSMLDPNEYKEIDKDINNWMSEMQIREKDLEEGKTTMINPPLHPDIRQFPEKSLENNCAVNSKNTANKCNRIASCDYAAWDKYDVDTELNKIDIREEQQQVEAKRFQQKQREAVTIKKLEKHTMINKSHETNFNEPNAYLKRLKKENVKLLASLTGTELDVMAEQEREKGNEAFRAGDYEEALEHYNTSVKINSNIVTFNNRAITYIKLQRYEDALSDCNLVLSAEYTNIKALLRRAMALEHLQKSSQALVDYEAVLKLEPNNAVAISGVKKLRKPCESRKVRMTIEEQFDDTNVELKYDEDENKRNCSSQFNFNPMINLGSSICYCDRAPGPSQNLRPRPHIKADYCIECENNLTSKSKSNGISESIKTSISSSNNRSFNVKSSQDENHSATKQKSIFSYTTPSKRSSSVIIEELPSEPNNNNNSVNIKNKSKGLAEKKNNSNTKTANKSSDDKEVKISNVKNPGKSNQENSSPTERLLTKSSPRKIQVADKYENKTSKEDKYISKNFNSIENSYEFMRIWRSLKNDTNLEAHAQLLRAINIDKLNLVLGNELDGNIFSTILRCLKQHFCTSKDTELLNIFLRSFGQMKRFSIVNMFMNAEDKRVIKIILNFLEEHGTSEVSSLRQIYSI